MEVDLTKRALSDCNDVLTTDHSTEESYVQHSLKRENSFKIQTMEQTNFN